MEISQKRGAASTRYVFHDDRVEYAWKDSSGSRTFSVQYTEISRDRQTLTERNVWFRNVGYFWLALGLFLLVATWRDPGAQKGWLWSVLGAGCIAAYYGYPIRYRILPSEKGNLLVLDHGDTADRIEAEIVSRRAAQFRAEYDFVPEGDSPEQLRNRFNWLHREGALTDEELQARLARVDTFGRDNHSEASEPEQRTLN
jgi:hypothetical protein